MHSQIHTLHAVLLFQACLPEPGGRWLKLNGKLNFVYNINLQLQVLSVHWAQYKYENTTHHTKNFPCEACCAWCRRFFDFIMSIISPGSAGFYVVFMLRSV